MVCVRRAWLTLGAQSIDLENAAAGWFCTELDLGGMGEVRDVTNNRADQDGIWDRTAYLGGRVISANITTLAAAGAQIDDVAADFGPFMVPAARPVLHYILDRPGAPERVLTVRGSGYSWPIAGVDQRDIQLQWVAADPVARDPTWQTVTAWAGSSTSPGRTYPLTFNRSYPSTGGVATPGFIVPAGDVAVRPLFRVYGPATAPWIQIQQVGGAATQYVIYFRAGYVIAAGAWVDVDSAAKTVYKNSDPAQPDPSALNWANVTWPALTPGISWRLALSGGSTGGVTQVQAIWQNGYLT